MRFLCDEMLKGLARWLRAAGYDTRLPVDGAHDRELIAEAVREERLLVTRDRKLLEHAAGRGRVVFLGANSTPECARELSSRLPVDWLHRPFTRCLKCNTRLVGRAAGDCPMIPADVLRRHARLRYCPHCVQCYWDGGHVRRMRRVLSSWARGAWVPSAGLPAA